MSVSSVVLFATRASSTACKVLRGRGVIAKEGDQVLGRDCLFTVVVVRCHRAYDSTGTDFHQGTYSDVDHAHNSC